MAKRRRNVNLYDVIEHWLENLSNSDDRILRSEA